MTELSTTVGRVARAIEKAQKKANYEFCLLDFSTYEGKSPPHVVEAYGEFVLRTNDKEEARELYDKLVREYVARAAIEEMETPTEAMILVGGPLVAKAIDEPSGFVEAETVWRAMVKTALAEPTDVENKNG